jgi:hypothetical protein
MTALKEKQLREIEETRVKLVGHVNAKMDELRDIVLTGNAPDRDREIIWPLTTMPELFKGRKPAAILFGEERVPVSKWREVYTLILKRCAADTACHGALMGLRNKIHGRSRTILSDKPGGMDCPIEVCSGLYAEGDFDTGALIRMLIFGILAPAGYDYSVISVVLRG